MGSVGFGDGGIWGRGDGRTRRRGDIRIRDTATAPLPPRPSPSPQAWRFPSAPLHPIPSLWPWGTMNVLAPVRRDRVVADLPQCFRKEAALHTRPEFHSSVTGACQEQRTGTVGFKISKIIVVGDLAVGKTCLINRFCKDTFDKNYKATIGVDFEMERFEVLGVPFSLQLWDTAGQERFKCIASTYYRGAQGETPPHIPTNHPHIPSDHLHPHFIAPTAIVIVFDVNDVASLDHTRQWLADALKENDPSNVILFLVGSKKDLSTPAQYSRMEKDALRVAQEMQAEFWAVSSLTALTFESSVLAELERGSARRIGDAVRIGSTESDLYLSAPRKKPKCCQ
ncbi:ras-related protein Rab-34 isoform X3 [Gallus gallus]|uniref:ras-related protein Rab-34 isoform X3 n=1 Tax=Gallus gallus TaxID=9031 RepID=UPI001AE900C7|nr:ras-related protein Rab-34 isoform X3 [Gallus gallus]XP_040543184.1 ras-related protein Rab-34 isoform X3 [Gallus gallus]